MVATMSGRMVLLTVILAALTTAVTSLTHSGYLVGNPHLYVLPEKRES
jgi:hypothetical protein